MMQISPLIFSELRALGPCRVQKVWGLFKSVLVMEIYSHQHKRWYFIFDQNPQTSSIHVQDTRPQGVKTISPFILSIKKRSIGCAISFHPQEDQALMAKLQGHELKSAIYFCLSSKPYAALYDDGRMVIASKKNLASDRKNFTLTAGKPLDSLVNNLAQAQLHQAALLNFHRQSLQQIYLSKASKKLKKQRVLLKNILSDQKKFTADLELEQRAELLKMNFHLLSPGMNAITLTDYLSYPPNKIKVPLDPKLKPKEQLHKLFAKVKRAKRGLAHIKARLAAEKAKLADLEAAHLRQSKADMSTLSLSDMDAEASSLGPRRKGQEKRKPYREYLAQDGTRLWVGKSAKDSDELSLRHAQGNEWWLHARDVAGAHVVVKSTASALLPATLVQAAMLAAHFSKAKGQPRATISYTQVKNIKKQKGLAAGKVLLSKEKTLEIKIDGQALQDLLSQNH